MKNACQLAKSTIRIGRIAKLVGLLSNRAQRERGTIFTEGC